MDNIQIDLNNVEISDEQAEEIAYAIYNDITDYIINNSAKFFTYIIENLYKNKRIILDLEHGVICEDITKNEYQICKYR